MQKKTEIWIGNRPDFGYFWNIKLLKAIFW